MPLQALALVYFLHYFKVNKMADVYEQMAGNLINLGGKLISRSMSGVETTDYSNQLSQLSSKIVGEVIPGVYSKKLDGPGAVKSVIEMGNKLGIPAPQSIKLLNDIRGVGERMELEQPDMMKQLLGEYKLMKADLDVLGKQQDLFQKSPAGTFEKAQTKEGFPVLKQQLNKFKNILDGADDENDRIDQIESEFGVSIEPFFGKGFKSGENWKTAIKKIARKILENNDELGQYFNAEEIEKALVDTYEGGTILPRSEREPVPQENIPGILGLFKGR